LFLLLFWLADAHRFVSVIGGREPAATPGPQLRKFWAPYFTRVKKILPRNNSVDGFALLAPSLGLSRIESNELGQRVRPMSAPARSGHAALRADFAF
jgi:hypothetical protein